MCAGPLPWDLLSESSEELTPRERQNLVTEEEQKPAQQTTANGSAVQKAPAPDAKGMLTAKTMSIADQLATGLLTAGEHLQAGFLAFYAFPCSVLCAQQDPASVPFGFMLDKGPPGSLPFGSFGSHACQYDHE